VFFQLNVSRVFSFVTMEGWGKHGMGCGGMGWVGLSGIEFGCLLIAKSRFNCSEKKTHFACGWMRLFCIHGYRPFAMETKTFDSALCGFQCLRKQPKNIVGINMYLGGCCEHVSLCFRYIYNLSTGTQRNRLCAFEIFSLLMERSLIN
jgi:hypothetical protein